MEYIWNILLFCFIFPYLIYIKKSIFFTYIVYILLLVHIYIFIYQFRFNKQVQWSIYSECIAILFGNFFIYESLMTNNLILLLFGLLIIYDHGKKILYPNKSYYV